eukprot:20381-Heterococcus_DN1.PRE.1
MCPWSAIVLRIASNIMLTDSQAETAQLPAVKALSHVQHVPALHANAPSLKAFFTYTTAPQLHVRSGVAKRQLRKQQTAEVSRYTETLNATSSSQREIAAAAAEGFMKMNRNDHMLRRHKEYYVTYLLAHCELLMTEIKTAKNVQ